MENYDLNLISKKRRIDYAITEDIPNLKGERGSNVPQSAFATTKFSDNVVRQNCISTKLYFKGLVSDATAMDRDMKDGLGVAICDEADNLLYGINESLNGTVINREEVEIVALITGFNEAIRLGVRNVVICCDDHQIYQIIIGREKPTHKIVHLVEEVLRLRGKMTSTELVLVEQNDVKFAFSLARDAMVSQSSSTSSVDVKAAQGEICTICLEETNAECMFFNEKCFHLHCFSCVKQYVEVKLLSGTLPTCLEYGCKSELTLESCSKVLTPKLIEMWKTKMKEDLIPAAEKIYCPYPSCSVLMSKTELSSEAEQSNVRACIKCCGLFCIDCNVPWHSDLSCADYKKLHPEPLVDDLKLKSLANDKMWRQCAQCRHMIELTYGCSHMTCRCGYEFCYKCGIEWKKSQQECPSGCLLFDDDDDDDDDEDDEDDYDDDDDNGDDDDGDDNHDDDDGDDNHDDDNDGSEAVFGCLTLESLWINKSKLCCPKKIGICQMSRKIRANELLSNPGIVFD